MANLKLGLTAKEMEEGLSRVSRARRAKGNFLFINGPLDGQRHDVDFRVIGVKVETRPASGLVCFAKEHFYSKVGASFYYVKQQNKPFA